MQTIEQHRHYANERLEANRRFEEMTDIAERLGYPIDTTIRYEVRHGAAYARTDTVDRPFHNQTFQAWQRGLQLFTGDQAFEVERLRLEHEEALMIDSFGSGDLAGNVIIKLSKVPDAVVENRTSIKGYRRDLLRSFVRIYYRDPEGVSCRLFTLDHNHPAGMEAVGHLLGIDVRRPSETVLADHTLLHVPTDTEQFVADLVENVVNTYDSAIYMYTSRQTSAGSNFSDRVNAMQAVSERPELFQEHMDAISGILGHSTLLEDAEALLESQRELTAAAIKLATEGHDIVSSSSSEVAHEVESGNYGRECATTMGMNQAQATNTENVWRQGECQVCFARTTVGSCMVCANCAAADDRGEDLLKLRDKNMRERRARQAAALAFRTTAETEQLKRNNTLTKNQYGQKVRFQKVIRICGQDTLVLNDAGEVIDTL